RHGTAAAPPPDRGLADPEFGCQFSDRPLAALDIGTRLRRRRGVGVQVQFHDTRRSLTKATPRSTPIPSSQSPRTKHVRRDDFSGLLSHPRGPHSYGFGIVSFSVSLTKLAAWR